MKEMHFVLLSLGFSHFYTGSSSYDANKYYQVLFKRQSTSVRGTFHYKRRRPRAFPTVMCRQLRRK